MSDMEGQIPWTPVKDNRDCIRFTDDEDYY